MIVVDSSVAFKWFVTEPHMDAALALLETEQLIAPDLIIAEVMNATWKVARRRILSEKQVAEIPKRLPKCLSQIFPTLSLADRALQIAFDLDHPVYDAFYIALALQVDSSLITADERLFQKTRRTRFAKLVRPLVP